MLAITVGETFADYLNVNLNLGLTITSVAMAAFLTPVLVFQFRAQRYLPAVCWLAVVVISVVDTLITGILTDDFGVPLWASAALFALALAITLSAWFASEKTLSIRWIFELESSNDFDLPTAEPREVPRTIAPGESAVR